VGLCPTSWPPSEYRWCPLLKMTSSESSVIPFLAPGREIWLTPTAPVPCSNAANKGERKTSTQSEFCTWQNSLKGKSPRKCIYNVPSHETAKHRAVWLTSIERRRCSNEAKTRNPLKFTGVPQTANQSQPLVWTEVHHIVRTCG